MCVCVCVCINSQSFLRCLYQVFDRLRKEQSSALSKIVLISGNVGETDLDIDADDAAKLTEQVSVIIHNAATIRFTEPIKYVYPRLNSSTS